MLTVSDQWKEYTEDNHNYEIKAVLTLEDGTVLNLTGDDFMSACINDAVSEMDSITIGAVVTNRFSGSLNNMSGKFDGLDLEGATLEVKVGLIYEDETEEWLDKGVYILDQPSMIGAVLQISAYDYMDKMNRYYLGTHPVDGVQTPITFPVASETLASWLCDYCGVSYEAGFWQIENNLDVEEFEFNESTTCREVLNWILQINCGYARISNEGYLEVKWLGEGYWSTSDALDGGTIQPWSGAENADGGIMDPWAVVPDINGGFVCVTIDKVTSVEMSSKDVKVTGVRAYAYGTVDEFSFNTAGGNGYILALQDNPLITEDRTEEIANAVNGTVNGLGFRPYNAKIEANPILEAGDAIAIMDYKGEYHMSLITNLTFNWGAATSISCGAESASKKDIELSNPTTSVIQGAVTAAYDYITAKKISADVITAGTLGVNGKITATDLEITGGEVGNFTIQDGKIKSTYTVPHTYTNDDLTIMNDIISQGTIPTQEQLDLYDLDQDGEITLDDTDLVNTIIMQYGGVLTSTVTLDPSNYAKMVTTENNLGNLSYLGGWGGVFDHLMWEGKEIKDIITGTLRYNYGGFSAYGVIFSDDLLIAHGEINLGSCAMTNGYGSSYYVSKSITFPINFGNTVRMFQISPRASSGLISAMPYSVSASGFSAYIFDASRETKDVILDYTIVCN